MHIINITVRNKVAVNPAQDRYVCGNSDYEVHFDFDAEWNAHETKTARFIKEDGTPYDVVFSGNVCPVPVISDTYKLQVGVYAGNLSTTTAAYVPCKKSILCGGGVPAAPADDVYNQIMAKLNSLESCCVVTATIGDAVNETTFSCTFDKSGAEVVAAIKAGQNAVCLLSMTGEAVNVFPVIDYKDSGFVDYQVSSGGLTVTIRQDVGNSGSVLLEQAIQEVRPTTPIYMVSYVGTTATTTCNMTFAEIVACIEAGTLGIPIVWRKQRNMLARIPLTVQTVSHDTLSITYANEESHGLYHNSDGSIGFAYNEGA